MQKLRQEVSHEAPLTVHDAFDQVRVTLDKRSRKFIKFDTIHAVIAN